MSAKRNTRKFLVHYWSCCSSPPSEPEQTQTFGSTDVPHQTARRQEEDGGFSDSTEEQGSTIFFSVPSSPRCSDAENECTESDVIRRMWICQPNVPPHFIEFLESRKGVVPWRQQLNMHNHPKGRKVNQASLGDSTTRTISARGLHHARLHLECSFEPGDDQPLDAEGEGRTKEKAMDEACRMGLAILLLNAPYLVLLGGSGAHWKYPADVIRLESNRVRNSILGLSGAADANVPPPPYPHPVGRRSGYVEPRPHENREQMQLEALRKILRFHGGCAEPYYLRNQMWLELDKLFERKALKPFLQAHAAEFNIIQTSPKRWAFAFREA